MNVSNQRVFRHFAILMVISLAVISCRSTPIRSQFLPTTVPTAMDREVPYDLHEPMEDILPSYYLAYEEDFSSTPDDWDIHDFDNGLVKHEFSLRDGQLIWEVTASDHSLEGFMPYIDLDLPQDNFYIEVNMKIESDDNPYGVGLIFRCEDGANYYYAGIDKTGAIEAGGFIDDDWTTFIEPKRSDHFVRNEMNRFGVRSDGNYYMIYVNGELVDWFIDDTHKNGTWGLGTDVGKGDRELVMLDRVSLFRPNNPNAPLSDYQDPDTVLTSTPKPTETVFVVKTPVKTFAPKTLPTMMGMGASLSTYEGETNGMSYNISYPAAFLPTTVDGAPALCLDAPEKLCLKVLIHEGNWSDSQALASDMMEDVSHTLKYYQEIDSQSTQTAEGRPAFWVNYYGSVAGRRYENSRMFVVVQSVGFDLVVEGEPKVMQVYREVINSMLLSFSVQ